MKKLTTEDLKKDHLYEYKRYNHFDKIDLHLIGVYRGIARSSHRFDIVFDYKDRWGMNIFTFDTGFGPGGVPASLKYFGSREEHPEYFL